MQIRLIIFAQHHAIGQLVVERPARLTIPSWRRLLILKATAAAAGRQTSLKRI